MTDKQVRALSKPQMLTLLLQQEQEIEKLTSDLNNAAKKLEAVKSQVVDVAPELLGAVLRAAQEAADNYVLDAKNAEDEKRKELVRMEEEIRNLRREADRYYSETIAEATRVVDKMCGAFKGQIDQANQIYSEFQSMITTNSPSPEKPGYPEP